MTDFIEYPIDGTLDLHMFRPNEVRSVLDEYLLQCRMRGILHVRIIHGKGQGVLRNIVRSYLQGASFVREFQTSPDASGWGGDDRMARSDRRRRGGYVMKVSRLLCVIFSLAVLTAGNVSADVRLPSLISDNMVLQREADIRLWGWADRGEHVEVALAGHSGRMKTGKDGMWEVTLPPMQAGGPYTLTISGTNTIVMDNIMIGDVWVCSGQSNMEWKVCHARDGLMEVAKAHHPEIRIFDMINETAIEPSNDCVGQWEECRPSTISEFSAAGYFFGRELQAELGVPIGLINVSWGGSGIETWISREGFNRNDTTKNAYAPLAGCGGEPC